MKIYIKLFAAFLVTFALHGRLLAVPLLPLVFSPTALVFPITTLGDSSLPLTVTIHLRDASKPLGPISLQLSDPLHFEIVSDTCSGTILENAETCDVSAIFHPEIFGHYSSFLVLLDENMGLGNFVPLEGVGVEAGFTPTPPPTSPPETKTSLSPYLLDFEGLFAGDTSDPQTSILTNTGTADLFVKAVTFGGDAPFSFARIETCSLRAVSPGGTCDIIAYFSPALDGPQKAAIAVSGNFEDSPQILSLNGGSGGGIATGGGCALNPMQSSDNGFWCITMAISSLVFASRRRLQ